LQIAKRGRAAKLENDTETFEHERVSSELKKQIQSARLAKKLTQAQVGLCQGDYTPLSEL
jgi:hypothetical protein